MTFQDLFITPIYFILISLVAYLIRPYVTTPQTRKFFLPALWIRFIGAIFLGLIYQFYYSGGDTFNYFTHGSRWIWEAIVNEPSVGIRMLFDDGGAHVPEFFDYSSRIWYYRDPKSYSIVRIAAFIDIFTFHTYSATALFFAAFSFSGLWAMFTEVQRRYPQSRYLFVAILFTPSVVFWGSGILKDTITLGALGWLTWCIFGIIEGRSNVIYRWIIAVLAILLILKIKSYIVICFVPTVFVWVYLKNLNKLKNRIVRLLTAPVLALIFAIAAAGSSVLVSTEEYNIGNFAQKAAITAYDIRYGWGARVAGDGGYSLGALDGTWQSTIRLMPAAINVSLFRPYLWEVKNPLMMLSAMESLIFLMATIVLVVTGRWRSIASDPFLVFCFIFSILFAFAVGISTYNFGTLMRYKIPFVPFFMVLLFVKTRK